MEHVVKILSLRQVTHDVRSIRFEKPAGYQFVPGQATDVSVNSPDIKNELRPFTFTSLNEDPWLEFTIKRYPEHQGITDRIHRLGVGDELIIRDVWGAIEYRGPGYFIAGGAGITPFLAILRHLLKKGETAGNQLFFSNKTSADIIYEQELVDILGDQAHFILTRESKPGYDRSYLNGEFFKKHIRDFTRQFYVCGPDPMIQEISQALTLLGVKPEAVTFEK